MADEETKEMLRELVTIQRQHLELVRGMNEIYEKQAAAQEESHTRWRQKLELDGTASSIANILRGAALVIMAAVIAYLVFFGLHRH